MYSFGKTPPRAIESFGVAGLLSEAGKVFYSSLFTARHVGRVSDLICARLQEAGLDELRLRALILFGAFEVFRGQVLTGEEVSKHRLSEPLVLECGLDDDKVAVGVSFTAQQGRFPKLEGLAARISSGATEGPFEALLREIYLHSDRTIVRAQGDVQRIELVALMGIPGKMEADALSAKPPVEIILMGNGNATATPKVEEYVEIGDLDYPELLKEDSPGAGSAAPATGEVLVHGCTAVEDAVSVRAQQLIEKMGSRVKGGSAQPQDELIRVSGTQAPLQDDAVVIVSGGSSSKKLHTVFKVKGHKTLENEVAESESETESESESREGKSKNRLSKPTFSGSKTLEAEEDIEEAEEQTEAEVEGEELEEEGLEEEAPQGNFFKMIKKVKNIWPFSQSKSDEEEDDDDENNKGLKLKKSSKRADVGSEEEDNEDEDADTLSAPFAVSSKESGLEGKGLSESGSSQVDADEFTKEFQSDFDRTLSKAQLEIIELKKELTSPRAKRWVEALMSELVAEKSKIHDFSKKLSASVKQKEHEFRSQEVILREELRRRDDHLRAKDHALTRLKEQVSQSTMAAERMKSSKAGAADDAHYKQKYGLVQKMLNSSKEENAFLTEKIDDLKNQLMNAQLTSSKRAGPSMVDFNALQSKYERAIRQTEESKKANQQLLEKLNEAKKDRTAGSQEDSKKLLNDALKMAALNKKEAEKLTLKVDEMKSEQLRLQNELNKSINDLKVARNNKVLANKQALSTPAQPDAAQAKSAAAAVTKPKPPKAA